MIISKKSLLFVASALHRVGSFELQPFSATFTQRKNADVSPQIQPSFRRSVLQMGLLNKISKAFLQEREGDFIKLEDSDADDTIESLGPVVLLYNIPDGILDDELTNMLEDGAPKTSRKGVTLQRIPDMNHPLLDLTLEEALQKVIVDPDGGESSSSFSDSSPIAPIAPVNAGNPVLIFSGFANPEMMACYNIIAEEIFRENGGQAACAKAVPNALPKPLRQVLEEISGDHQNALGMK